MIRFPFVLRRTYERKIALASVRTPMAQPTFSDILLRLDSDATGIDVHVCYYRRDAADAAKEIRFLRELAAEQALIIEELKAQITGGPR